MIRGMPAPKYTLDAFKLSPPLIRRLVLQIPVHRYDEVLQPGRFSPREVIAHLADWDPIFRERLAGAAANPGYTIRGYDESQMAIDHLYDESDITLELEKFTNERAGTVAVLSGLSEADWKLGFVHPEMGPYTIREYLAMLVGHDMYHAEQLSEYMEEKTAATW